jgi:hypothetical protein
VAEAPEEGPAAEALDDDDEEEEEDKVDDAIE